MRSRAYDVICWRCMAVTEISTDWNGRLVEIPGVCTCTPKVEDMSAGYESTRPCETKGCANLCRTRYCLPCSGARQAELDRNRRPGVPLPKCGGCGATLSHHLSRWCVACRKVEEKRIRDAAKAGKDV